VLFRAFGEVVGAGAVICFDEAVAFGVDEGKHLAVMEDAVAAKHFFAGDTVDADEFGKEECGGFCGSGIGFGVFDAHDFSFLWEDKIGNWGKN